MDNKQYNALFSFIWNIANDVLVHAFEKGDYKKIILPFSKRKSSATATTSSIIPRSSLR